MLALTVPHRFHGPPRSGNGGWTAGALAERLPVDAGTPVTVALRLPPPLDTPLAVNPTDAGIAASLDGRPVAEARAAAADPVVVPPVALDEAADAETRFPGHRSHPFPSCFACGPDRAPGDGLRIFPGALAGGGDGVAATWTPYDVSAPIAWAALDCSGGWACDLEDRPMVLGTITLRLDRLPVAGTSHVVVGQVRGVEGRKTFTASTLYDPDGAVVATAEHVWITVNVEDFS